MEIRKMTQMLDASNRRGIIIGVCVTVAIILAVALAIVKIKWLKKTFCCGCELDDFDDEYYLDEDDLDENGCAYTGDKDFV